LQGSAQNRDISLYKINNFINLITVKLKIFPDKNIGGNNICDYKIPIFMQQEGHFLTVKIFTANIFIRKYFLFFYLGDGGS
jgi:hypothetical protein